MFKEFNSSIYMGEVVHQRYFPQRYRFVYRIFCLLLDIDELDVMHKRLRFFSFEKFNLFSFYRKDHASRKTQDLRAWLVSLLKDYQPELAQYLSDSGKIYLQCMPRILGFTFNPISIWYCFDEHKNLLAIVCEVKNTFGEQHSYVLHDNELESDACFKAEHVKNFHVSPFISMQGNYKFLIQKPADTLSVVINEYQNKENDKEKNKHQRQAQGQARNWEDGSQLLLTASQHMHKAGLSDALIVKHFFKVPLLTLKVVFMIHWQALKIWLRGGTYYKKPSPPEKEHS